MILVAAVGWGLIATGALSHVWHHRRLRALLGRHFEADRPMAFALTVVEVALAVGIPLALLTGSGLLSAFSVAGGGLALGFAVWVGRLLSSGSDLPCACSFSEAPPNRWSLLRAIAVGTVVLFVVADGTGETTAMLVATLAVGWGARRMPLRPARGTRLARRQPRTAGASRRVRRGSTMTAVALSLALLGGTVVLAVVFNHAYARLAVLELALNEGLPPGHERAPAAPTGVGPLDAAGVLDAGVHVFLSRNCHACQRLLDELASTSLESPLGLVLHYADRPRAIAHEVADGLDAHLVRDQAELAASVGADPLPYTIAVGDHALVGRSVTPTVAAIAETARNAGLRLQVEHRAR